MTTDTTPHVKLLITPSREPARLVLFVFPHAGSGAFPYRTLAAALPPWVELAIAQIPGRETTFGAPMFRSMAELTSPLAALVSAKKDLPSVFLGHSFGSHLALAVARRLERESRPLPRAVVVSSTRAPHIPPARPLMHTLSRAGLVAVVRGYGGTPEEVLQNNDLMDLFLPPLRADLEILETYTPEPGEPFSFPLFAFGGQRDTTTRREDIEAWSAHTRGPFALRMLEGGHFYLLEQSKAAFAAALRDILEEAARSAQP